MGIEFLQKIIPVIRSHSSQLQRLADGQIAIDALKLATTDPEYERPVPPEIISISVGVPMPKG
jgi:hypothetical protein